MVAARYTARGERVKAAAAESLIVAGPLMVERTPRGGRTPRAFGWRLMNRSG